MPISRRGFALGVLLMLFGVVVAPPASSGSEEDVERAQQEEEAAARRRAEALHDLNAAVTAFEAVRAELELTNGRIRRLDATLADYEVQRVRIRADALDQAAEAYIASFDRETINPSPDDAQEVLATQYVLERVTASNQSAINRLIAIRAEMETLRAELAGENEQLAELETEMAAVVERLDALLEDAQAEYDAARQARITTESQFEAEQARARIFLCPVDGPVAFTDTWGAPRPGGRRHRGQDLHARVGTPLVAVKDGWIKWPSYNSIAGHMVRLRTADGTEYSYAHMNTPTMWSAGDWVQQGTVIGYVGDTGNAYVPHLHISMWPNGGWSGATNPYSLLDAACG